MLEVANRWRVILLCTEENLTSCWQMPPARSATLIRSVATDKGENDSDSESERKREE